MKNMNPMRYIGSSMPSTIPVIVGPMTPCTPVPISGSIAIFCFCDGLMAFKLTAF